MLDVAAQFVLTPRTVHLGITGSRGGVIDIIHSTLSSPSRTMKTETGWSSMTHAKLSGSRLPAASTEALSP